MNNGITSDRFQLSKSVWQRCPLRSNLYILVAEILSLKISLCPDVVGISIFNTGKSKTHAQYADDIWALIKNQQTSFDALLHIGEEF